MAKKSGAESKSAWFRTFFRENPQYLQEGSNKEVLERWSADHAGREPDDSIRNVMSNVKSNVRKEMGVGRANSGKKVGRPATSPVRVHDPNEPTVEPMSRRQLEELEFALDKCLTMAINLNNPALEDAMRHLRRARNLVVWQQGEPS